MRILAPNTDMTLPNLTGTIGEILDMYRVQYAGKTIYLSGEVITPDTVIAPEEEDDIVIEVKSSNVTVIKQVGEFAQEEVVWHEGMTVQGALEDAMRQAGLAVNTDELTCIDYSSSPTVSYPAGLRSEKVRPGAELHLSTQDKYSNG